MGEVIFCSWKGEVVDNRGKPPEERLQPEGLRVPESIEGQRVLALVGWEGLLAADERLQPLELARAYLEAVQERSCGRCFPCRVGTKVMLEILERICRGEAGAEELELLERVGRDVAESAKCGIGQTAPLPILQVLEHWGEEVREAVAARRPVETPRVRYRHQLTAPCLNACPVHLDIPGYVELIRDRRYEEALSLIRQRACLPGVLGRVCVHFCEESCRRGLVDEPICIKILKRFVADYELAHPLAPRLGPYRNGNGAKSVGVIGAGPAGLAAAHNLALRGHKVTVYEALPVAGGMAAVGIPPYRLPKDVLQREVDLVKEAGVEILLEAPVGQKVSLDELRRKHDALFIGIGCHDSAKMRVEGEDAGYDGFVPGVKFLRDLNLGHPMKPRRRVVVVGGGNVAMDCVRSCLRLGFEEVNLVYRRSRAEMPANVEEIEEAEREGVVFHFLTNPTRVLAEGGKVVGVELIRMELGEPDASGRRRPVPIEGSEFVMEADVVIPAIGQVTVVDFLQRELPELKLTRRGTIEADPLTQQTSVPGVFAGGDCVSGPATLVEAIAAGNRAAQAMDCYLRGEPLAISPEILLEELLKPGGIYDPQEDVGLPPGYGRRPQRHLSLEERARNFREVELGLATPDALRDSERCLRCYRVVLYALEA